MTDALASLAPVAASTAAAVTATASSQPASIPLWIELFVVVVSAGTGVLTARENKLDYVGALWLAVLLGLGGGLIRDVILQVGDVYILKQPLALPACLAAATVVFVFPAIIEKPDKFIAVLDIFSVGLYAAIGADKAYVYGFAPTVCIMMGFFTAVGGGMLRDICLARVPYIFQRSNLYAIAAIAGAIAYMTLIECLGMWNIAAATISVALTMLIRWWSIRYNIMSPTEFDPHKLPEPVKKVARPVVRPIQRAGHHVSAKTSQAAARARDRKRHRRKQNR